MSSRLGVRQWCPGPGNQTRTGHTRDNGITEVNNDNNIVGLKSLPPMPPLIPLHGRRKRHRRVSVCSVSDEDNNKLLRLCGGGDSDSGVSVHSVDVEDVSNESVDNKKSEGGSRCTVILDPIPSVVLDSLSLEGSVSAEVAVRTCQQTAAHEWEESPPMISDNEVQGLLNGLVDEDVVEEEKEMMVGDDRGEVDMACCQRQESLLQQQAPLLHDEDVDDDDDDDKIDDDDVAESRDATVATSGRRKERHRKCEPSRRGLRRRRERRSGSNVATDCYEKRRKRSTSTSTSSSTCSTTSYPHKHRHKHRHRHRSSETSPPPPPPPPRPRVNPIFVWVKQEDTRIVEVLCEDYDKRNRIRLTKTPQGWRAIPRTERLASFPLTSTPTVPSIAAEETRVDILPTESSSVSRAPELTSHMVPSVTDDKQYLTLQDVSLSQQTKAVDCEETAALCADVDETLDTATRPVGVQECRDVSSHGPADQEDDLPVNEHMATEHEDESKTIHIENIDIPDVSLKEMKSEVVESNDVFINDDTVVKNDVAESLDVPVHESVATSESVSEQIEQTVEPEINHVVQKDDVVLESTTILETVANETTEHDAPDVDDLVPTDLTVPKSVDGTRPTPTHITPVRSMASILRTPKILTPTLLSALNRASPRPGISPALPEPAITPGVQPAHQTKLDHKSMFLESLLSTPRTCHQVSKPVVTDDSVMPLDLGKSSTRCLGSPTVSCSAEVKKVTIKSDVEERKPKCKVENITLKTLLNRRQEQQLKEEKHELKIHKKVHEMKKTSESSKDRKSRLLELLTSEPTRTPDLDPLTQLKKILSDPDMAIPDPLLVPRDRLQDLVTCPAKEIPRLLTLRPELRLPEALAYPSLLKDPNLLVVSISYLQSLLRSPEKPNKDDDSYSTLGAFLEWQRYQGIQQNEYLEAQLKQQALRSSNREIDAATAQALNQMMWLPYLNQLEASAMNCGNNQQEFLNMLNAVFPAAANYPNAFPGGVYPPAMSPGFPIPTDYKSQMELQHTLAMWQEAMMQSSPPSSNMKLPLDAQRHVSKKCSAAARTSPIGPNFHPQSRVMGQQLPVSGGYPSHPQVSQHPPRPRHQGNRHHHQHNSQPSGQPQPKQPKTEMPSSMLLDPAKIKTDKTPPPQQQQTTTITTRPTVTCKPLRNLLSSPRRDDINMKPSASSTHTPSHSHLLAALGKQPSSHHSLRPHSIEEHVAKLKVKQHLVDTSLTPKLLKQEIKPEVAVLGDDKVSTTQLHPNLWHPLFGSQKTSYNSPWQWTRVTVNGE